MPQPTLNLPIDNEEIWAEQIWRKTLGLVDYRISEALAKCGKEEWYRTCAHCRTQKTFSYKCCQKWCPKCNWRISRERANVVAHWSVLIKQPKHIVLTRRNTQLVDRCLLRHTMKSFGKLRRQKEWKDCKGGCVSMEVTNEGKGWHVHLHILADVRWMPAGLLAQRWAEQMGQDYAIVKVKDAREHQYRAELTKYVVKASEMAQWPAEEIAALIGAVRGVRMFAPFGQFYKLQRSIRAQIQAEKPEAQPCECGCRSFYFDTETSEIWRKHRSRL